MSNPPRAEPPLGIRESSFLSAADEARTHVVSDAAVHKLPRQPLPQSRRMRLCELGYEDIPWLSSLFAQTGMYPLLMDSPTRFIDVAAIVACVQRLYATMQGLGAWRAQALDGAFVGLFSLLPVARSADVEIHVRLKPEAWGRWYAIEGTQLLCRQAFEAAGLPRLFGYCHPDHQRVRRIMSHFGFRDRGLCEHRRQIAHCYELDAQTWRERSATVSH